MGRKTQGFHQKIRYHINRRSKGGRILGGRIGNVPINVESFKRPTPTFS
jgi:hypothetical protein